MIPFAITESTSRSVPPILNLLNSFCKLQVHYYQESYTTIINSCYDYVSIIVAMFITQVFDVR